MTEHIESPLPRHRPDIDMLEAALANARIHLERIENSCSSPSKPVGLRKQRAIIAQYERQIAELKETQWLAN